MSASLTGERAAGGPRARAAAPPGARPLLLGGLHLVVDAATVATVLRAADAGDLTPAAGFALVLGYDLLAFGAQPLLGLGADRLRAHRAAAVAGLALAALGLGALPLGGLAAMLLAALGNALFHLGAGALVLAQAPGRAAPAGLFVGPGAIGLALGLWLGGDPARGPLWPLGAALLAGLAAFAALRDAPARRLSGGEGPRDAPAPPTARVASARAAPAPAPAPPSPPAAPALAPPAAALVVGLLLVSVAVRAFMGFAAGHAAPAGAALLLGVPLAACAGKCAGGLIADRRGWIATTTVALALATPLLAFGGRVPASLLLGLFCLQLTMPVTLAAAAQALPRWPAAAFGLTCLALILGALPTFFPAGARLYGPGAFVGLLALATVAVVSALRLLGAPRPRLGRGRLRSFTFTPSGERT